MVLLNVWCMNECISSTGLSGSKHQHRFHLDGSSDHCNPPFLGYTVNSDTNWRWVLNNACIGGLPATVRALTPVLPLLWVLGIWDGANMYGHATNVVGGCCSILKTHWIFKRCPTLVIVVNRSHGFLPRCSMIERSTFCVVSTMGSHLHIGVSTMGFFLGIGVYLSGVSLCICCARIPSGLVDIQLLKIDTSFIVCCY